MWLWNIKPDPVGVDGFRFWVGGTDTTHNQSCNHGSVLSVSLPGGLYSIASWGGGEIPVCDWCRSWGSRWCHRNNTTVIPQRNVVGWYFCLFFFFSFQERALFCFFTEQQCVLSLIQSRFYISRKKVCEPNHGASSTVFHSFGYLFTTWCCMLLPNNSALGFSGYKTFSLYVRRVSRCSLADSRCTATFFYFLKKHAALWMA